jgi:hypothetical protein
MRGMFSLGMGRESVPGPGLGMGTTTGDSEEVAGGSWQRVASSSARWDMFGEGGTEYREQFGCGY